MKKFVLLFCSVEQTGDSIEQWIAWFDANAQHLLDSGNPLGPGRWVTSEGASDLTDAAPAMGYALLTAESLADAERIVATSPAAAGVRVYEALPM
jgi:hypothetical protein